jgi:hypothetical protein
LYVWFPPIEHRYEIELKGPDGQQIRQRKPISPTNMALSRGYPLSIGTPFEKWGDVDWFFLKETFDVRTNGLHTLIVSAQVNAFTNFAIGRSQMLGKSVYYQLPPVTNTFNILPEQIKK